MAIGVFVLVANVVSGAICGTVEAIVGTAGDIYGINETIFAQGIGKVFTFISSVDVDILSHSICYCVFREYR